MVEIPAASSSASFCFGVVSGTGARSGARTARGWGSKVTTIAGTPSSSARATARAGVAPRPGAGHGAVEDRPLAAVGAVEIADGDDAAVRQVAAVEGVLDDVHGRELIAQTRTAALSAIVTRSASRGRTAPTTCPTRSSA